MLDNTIRTGERTRVNAGKLSKNLFGGENKENNVGGVGETFRTGMAVKTLTDDKTSTGQDKKKSAVKTLTGGKTSTGGKRFGSAQRPPLGSSSKKLNNLDPFSTSSSLTKTTAASRAGTRTKFESSSPRKPMKTPGSISSPGRKIEMTSSCGRSGGMTKLPPKAPSSSGKKMAAVSATPTTPSKRISGLQTPKSGSYSTPKKVSSAPPAAAAAAGVGRVNTRSSARKKQQSTNQNSHQE